MTSLDFELAKWKINLVEWKIIFYNPIKDSNNVNALVTCTYRPDSNGRGDFRVKLGDSLFVIHVDHHLHSLYLNKLLIVNTLNRQFKFILVFPQYFMNMANTHEIWNFNGVLLKFGKNVELQCFNWLNEHNHCLGWHLQSFSCNTNVSKILEFFIQFFTFNRELFPMNWKNETFSVRNMTQFLL